MNDLEIILVNDFSSDNTLSIIEEIKKEDSRIKIINNKKNMGTLFSRSIGVLSAKGKYIFHLDSDDMYLDEDIFSTITNIANRKNFDIIEFKGIASSYNQNILNNKIKEYLFTQHVSNKVLYQPELGLFPLIPGKRLGSFLIRDSTLCNKCIKSKIYQKTLNKIGKDRYSRYMILDEDRTIIYSLFNIAESMKYVQKYGILIIPVIGSTTRRVHKFSEIFLYKLYFCDIAITFSKDSYESRKPIVYLMIYLLDNNFLREIAKSNEYNKKLIISCINRVLYYNYISDEEKKEIRKRVSKLEYLK